jgi:hypothetical protein
MTVEIGRLEDVGLARETSRGTAEDSATFWIPKTSCEFEESSNKVVDESGLGVIDARAGADVVSKFAEGPLNGIVYDECFGLLLYAALGSLSTSADDPEDGVNTHSFTRLNSNQHPSLTIFKKDENLDEKYARAMLNELTINAALEDYVRYTAGFMSEVSSSTSSTPSYSEENPFLATHVTVKLASAISDLSGASAIEVRAINLTINKNVEILPSLSSVNPTDIVNKAFSISGDLELLFDDETYRDYDVDGTEMAALITIENGDVTIGTASNPAIEITLAPMTFRDWGKSSGQDDVVTQTVAFDGNFSIDDSKTISIDLINTTTSY